MLVSFFIPLCNSEFANIHMFIVFQTQIGKCLYIKETNEMQNVLII